MTYSQTNANGLVYPFAGRPGDGEAMIVAPGVLWVRMPIPIKGLDFINLWLIEDGDGWTMVDTGLATLRIRDLWEQIFARYLGGRPVTRLICTHFHPDHVGQAGWLAERWRAPLWMTLGEWSFGRMLMLDSESEVPADVLGFYRRAGLDQAAIDLLKARGFNNFRKSVRPIPRALRRIEDGETIRIGEHNWRVIVGRGHSPEHACLFNPALNLLISGDQILPRISPHIGVYPGEPDADPLRHYLASLGRFRGLPADVMVLPAHNDPFHGLAARLDSLADHHAARLDRLAAALIEPKTAVDLLPVLFSRDLTGDHAVLGVSEAVAHLNRLLWAGGVARTLAPDGAYRYCSRAATG